MGPPDPVGSIRGPTHRMPRVLRHREATLGNEHRFHRQLGSHGELDETIQDRLVGERKSCHVDRVHDKARFVYTPARMPTTPLRLRLSELEAECQDDIPREPQQSAVQSGVSRAIIDASLALQEEQRTLALLGVRPSGVTKRAGRATLGSPTPGATAHRPPC